MIQLQKPRTNENGTKYQLSRIYLKSEKCMQENWLSLVCKTEQTGPPGRFSFSSEGCLCLIKGRVVKSRVHKVKQKREPSKHFYQPKAI